MTNEERKQFAENISKIEVAQIKEYGQLFEAMHEFKKDFMPKSIFKYRGFHKNHLDALMNEVIYLSKPSAFNDPYDSVMFISDKYVAIDAILKGERSLYSPEGIEAYYNYLMSDSDNSLIKRYYEKGIRDKEIIKRLLQEPQDYLTEESVNLFSEKIRNADMLSKFIKDFQDSNRICSFSEKVDSLLMWPHYSDYHKGFVLEYDIEDLGFYKIFLYPVIYSDFRYDATSFALQVKENYFELKHHIPSILYNSFKSIDWSYEEEWRLIIPDSEERIELKPKAIYIGCKATDSDIAEIKQIVKTISKEKEIPMFKMFLDYYNEKYVLNYKPIE